MSVSGDMGIHGSITHSTGTLSVGKHLEWTTSDGTDTLTKAKTMSIKSGSASFKHAITVTGLMKVDGAGRLQLSSGKLTAGSLVVAGNVLVTNGGSIEAKADGAVSGTLSLDGVFVVGKDLSVTGIITHATTTSKNRGARMTVTGKVTVAKSAKVDVSQKSSQQKSCASGSCYIGTYAGAGHSPSYRYSNAPYGSVSNPDDLGAKGQYSSQNGGGLVMITCGSMELEGSILARGQSTGRGGTVNIKVTGGAVTGSGTIDVGVVDSGSLCSNTVGHGGGGGRAAITGFGSIDQAVLDNVRMDGSRTCTAGAGTLFHKQAQKNGKSSPLLGLRCPANNQLHSWCLF